MKDKQSAGEKGRQGEKETIIQSGKITAFKAEIISYKYNLTDLHKEVIMEISKNPELLMNFMLGLGIVLSDNIGNENGRGSCSFESKHYWTRFEFGNISDKPDNLICKK
jgi:hypothetical protein